LEVVGETSLAVEATRSRLDRTPADPITRIAYAQYLLESGDADSALAEAMLVRIVDPSSKQAHQIEADALIALGRPADALPILKSISGTSDLAAWKRMVSCAIAGGQEDEFRHLLGDPPDGIGAAEIALYRARGWMAVGKMQEAQEVLESAILSTRVRGTGIALAEAQGDPKLPATLRRAAQTSPGNPAIQSALARWFRLQARASEAYDSAAKALEVDPNNPEAGFEAGVALMGLGRIEEARDQLRSAFRTQPGRYEVRLALAGAFEAGGDLESARGLFRHMPESAPAAAWFMSGRLTLQGADLSAHRAGRRVPALRAWTLGLRTDLPIAGDGV
jgi:Flp pilus assembly protein TadD